jgi:hypothetical protein
VTGSSSRRDAASATTGYDGTVPEFTVQSLLTTPTVIVRDVYCQGSVRQQSAEEHATATQLVFPYRGAYVRHLGRDEAVAEANQVLFFNANEGYRVSHPVPGGDASLALIIDERCSVRWRRGLSCGTARRWHFGCNACGSMHAPRRSWPYFDTACAKTWPSLWKRKAWP